MCACIIRPGGSARVSTDARPYEGRRERMRRIFLCMILMTLTACCAVAQQAPLRPALTDPVDIAVQRLSVTSQRNEAFEDIPYNNGHLSARGCQAVSIANAVIALFGVEDDAAGMEIVKETARLLVHPKYIGRSRIELSRLPLLLDAQARAQDAQAYPQLARAIGPYPGEMLVVEDEIDAPMLTRHIEETDGAFVLAGRMTVDPDWSGMIDIMAALDQMGMGDALVCLANVGAGRASTGTPLGLGNNGHYLTVLLHVGTFMEQGRVYVLDSLPRAIAGEKSGYTQVLRSPYPFAEEKNAFADRFDASRIRETVIRLSIRDEAAWQSADAQEKAGMMSPLILYGPGVMLIAAK